MKRTWIALFGLAAVALVWWQMSQGETGNTGAIDLIESLFIRAYLAIKGRLSGLVTMVSNSNNALPTDAAVLEQAAGFVAEQEGYESTPYADPPGQSETVSIGYGHQIQSGDGFSASSYLSATDALSLLQSDLLQYASCVQGAVQVSLTTEQCVALVSLCYNIGCGAFQNSTLVSVLNNGDYQGAQAQFGVWRLAGGQINSGLVSRRAAEAALFGQTGIFS